MQYKPTEQFAAANGVKGASVRSRLCREGSYFGVKPHKLPNGRLLWPVDDLPQPSAARSAEGSK